VVSAHRLISRTGQNYKLVDDLEVAHHVGKSILLPTLLGPVINANYVCLGIELENLNDGVQLYPMPQLEMAAAQIAEWIFLYGHLVVLGHTHIDGAKVDPRGMPWPWLMRAIQTHYVGFSNADTTQ
jgi:N-acetyl-anhydromuramyl-L-alanine amidase AmpD